MTNDARLSHSICDHAKTPAARKQCRAGDAILRGARNFDHLVVDGVHYSVRSIFHSFSSPVEATFATYVNGTGWVNAGWISADFFAKATLVQDPRNA